MKCLSSGLSRLSYQPPPVTSITWLLVAMALWSMASAGFGRSHGVDGGKPPYDLRTWQSLQAGQTSHAAIGGGSRLATMVHEMQIVVPKKFKKSYRKGVLHYHEPRSGAQELAAAFKLHGSSSLGFPKNSLTLKFSDAKVALFGLAPAEKYVLYAPYSDKTLLRNLLAYEVFGRMGHWSVGTRLINLKVKVGDGDMQAMGLYVLTEKVALGRGKIQLPPTASTAPHYLLNVDRVKDGDAYVETPGGVAVIFDEPNKPSRTQRDTIKERLAAMEQALPPDAANHRELFSKYIDLDAAVDVFIVQEMSRNVDAYNLSSPFYWPQGGLLTFGPVWDFNLAFGNADYGDGYKVSGFNASDKKKYWIPQLLQSPQFCARLKQRWRNLRQRTISNPSLFAIIDGYAAAWQPYTAANFAIWPVLGEYVWPNPYYKLASYQDEVANLKSWLALRNQWLDKAIGQMACRP